MLSFVVLPVIPHSSSWPTEEIINMFRPTDCSHKFLEHLRSFNLWLGFCLTAWLRNVYGMLVPLTDTDLENSSRQPYDMLKSETVAVSGLTRADLPPGVWNALRSVFLKVKKTQLHLRILCHQFDCKPKTWSRSYSDRRETVTQPCRAVQSRLSKTGSHTTHKQYFQHKTCSGQIECCHLGRATTNYTLKANRGVVTFYNVRVQILTLKNPSILFHNDMTDWKKPSYCALIYTTY